MLKNDLVFVEFDFFNDVIYDGLSKNVKYSMRIWF